MRLKHDKTRGSGELGLCLTLTSNLVKYKTSKLISEENKTVFTCCVARLEQYPTYKTNDTD